MNLDQLHEANMALVSNNIDKYATRTKRAVEAALKSWMEVRGEKVEMTKLAENKFQFEIDFQHWMRSETIADVNREFEDAIRRSDKEGHIFKIEADGVGDEFVEALLSGLRPGMKLTAEAFFPLVSFTVTWTVVTRRAK
jgi:hypothetical protein